MPSQQCTRCGWVWDINSTRNINTLCESCRARKQQKVSDCIIWHGHYAADLITPLDDYGEPVLPGIRNCGHADCVRPDHIQKVTPAL